MLKTTWSDIRLSIAALVLVAMLIGVVVFDQKHKEDSMPETIETTDEELTPTHAQELLDKARKVTEAQGLSVTVLWKDKDGNMQSVTLNKEDALTVGVKR